MTPHVAAIEDQKIIRNIKDFDKHSGSIVERIFFNFRPLVLLVCAVVTALLGQQALKVEYNASYQSLIPASHPFVQNLLKHASDLNGLGNNLRIIVEAREGTILDADYLERLRKINDEIFLLPGVDRPWVKSLWTPTTRWLGVTEAGFDGGTVIPDDYDGSQAAVEQVRINISRAGEIGRLVSNDFRSSVIVAPLMDDTHRSLDYGKLQTQLEDLRARYSDDKTNIRIVGFAKIAGDLIEGLGQILAFFAVSIMTTSAMVYWYTRCVRSTSLVASCSLMAVIWQLGLMHILGFKLDPYSILVPFLIFAIGISHGAQKMNGITQDIGRGTHKLVAARYTFRRLFVAGLTALVCDAVGFGVLYIIDIPAIRDLALVASLGVAILIFTNLILLPVLLSYTGVGKAATIRSMKSVSDESPTKHPFAAFLDLFTRRNFALLAVAGGVCLAVFGYHVSRDLKIGDLDPGAPELRPHSRYNLDNAFLNSHYGMSSDVLIVMVETEVNKCSQYSTLMTVQALEWKLQTLPGVEQTYSLADLANVTAVAMNEGNPKWYQLLPDQTQLNSTVSRAPVDMYGRNCDLVPVFVYLRDHKADTLDEVVTAVQDFAEANDTEEVRFKLAGGNAGAEAATNIVIKDASRTMLVWIYGAVTLLAMVTFRSWRAVVCAVLPLMLTSILAEALMVWLGMGVKVATLPVTALGVGIGIDYALYILSVTLTQLRAGATLSAAYYQALLFTGKVVLLTGVTLAGSVAIWAFSPIKFQADMGIMLAFMFLWNMAGALILLPALARLLFGSGRSQADSSAKIATAA
ncbi:MMPL family transporter [Parvibaculum sp.]|uniref:efflux RND transporter permease subunit n=1 Tax=Parvibaculum sp. TaxID=2024848 RepID=UPI001D93A59B|nr:MMPL family transporter [Parvibaculum sp.]MBX3490361.1 RND family transporter [Parvibaculum sp.]